LLPTSGCLPLSHYSLPAMPQTPNCIGVGFLENEITPPNDEFTLAFQAAKAFGKNLPSSPITPYYGTDTLPLTTSLLSNEAVVFTVPASGFMISGRSPTFETCDINGNDIESGAMPCRGVTIPYTVQSTSLAVTPPSCGGSITGYLCNSFNVTITATTSFKTTTTFVQGSGIGGTSIYSALYNNCAAGCHFANGAGVGAWQVTYADTTQAPTASDFTDTFTSLTGSSCPAYTNTNVTPTVTTQCVTPGNPSASQMYQNACNGPNKDTGHHAMVSAGTACPAISPWLAEGANLD
ncbi:MAG: hypothetical protein ACRDQZ_11290, partial [Mycobacteriales bacterium]